MNLSETYNFSWRSFLSFSLLLSLLVFSFFREAFVEAKVLSSADLLMHTTLLRDEFEQKEPAHRLLCDAAFQFVPWQYTTISSLTEEGQFPYINQLNYCGSPHWANSIAACFCPLRAFIIPREHPRLWALSHSLELVLAGIGMYLLACCLGMGEGARWLGGLAWTFSGFLVVWKLSPQSASAWQLSWIFLGAAQLKQARWRSGFLATAGGVFLSWLGGHPETTCQMLFVVALYVLYLNLRRSGGKRPIALWATGIILGSMLAAFFVLPAAHYIFNSFAWVERAQEKSAWEVLPVFWRAIPGTVFPQIYGSRLAGDLPLDAVFGGSNTCERGGGYVGWLVPVIFIPLAFFRRKHIRDFWFWFPCALLCFALAVNVPVISNLFQALPVLGASAPMRMLLLSGFAALLLCMRLVDTFTTAPLTRKEKLSVTSVLTCVFLVSIVLAATMRLSRQHILDNYISPRMTAGSNRLATHPTFSQLTPTELIVRLEKTTVRYPLFMALTSMLGLAGIFAAGGGIRAAGPKTALLTVVIIFDLFCFGRGHTPAIAPEKCYPKSKAIDFLQQNTGPYRIAAVSSRVFPANAFAVYGLADIRGYDAIEPPEYMEMCIAAFGITGPRNFLFHSEGAYSHPLARLLGMKYLVTAPQAPRPGNHYQLAWQDEACRIYEVPDALPGYYLADSSITIPEREGTLARIRNWRAPCKEAILPRGKPSCGNGVVDLVKKDSRGYCFSAEMQSPGFLVIASPWMPGWEAMVNSTPAILEQVNHGLMGLNLPAGSSEIRLSYAPPWLREGIALSILALILLLITLFWPGKGK